MMSWEAPMRAWMERLAAMISLAVEAFSSFKRAMVVALMAFERFVRLRRAFSSVVVMFWSAEVMYAETEALTALSWLVWVALTSLRRAMSVLLTLFRSVVMLPRVLSTLAWMVVFESAMVVTRVARMAVSEVFRVLFASATLLRTFSFRGAFTEERRFESVVSAEETRVVMEELVLASWPVSVALTEVRFAPTARTSASTVRMKGSAGFTWNDWEVAMEPPV